MSHPEPDQTTISRSRVSLGHRSWLTVGTVCTVLAATVILAISVAGYTTGATWTAPFYPQNRAYECLENTRDKVSNVLVVKMRTLGQYGSHPKLDI